METFRLFAGIDWATKSHQLCVVDSGGKKLLEKSFEHSAEGLAALAEALTKLGKPAEIAVSIEVPRGPVVEMLMERGFAVFSINPKQLDRLRDRHTVAGAKDDRLDAYVLADSLRADMHLFRHLSAEDPLVVQLREVTREHAEATEELNRSANRLREQLLRYFPSLLTLCEAADEPWLWDLLEKAPTPAKARKLTRPKLGEILRLNRIRRFDREALWNLLQQPALQLAPGTLEAASAHVKRLLPRARLAHAQCADVRRAMDGLLAELSKEVPRSSEEDAPGQQNEHRDATILLSLPGNGRTVCATMLTEGSDAIQRRDYSVLRAQSGVAPVTKRSGKSETVHMRYACNNALRTALFNRARVAMQHDAHVKQRYAAARARGLTHGHALRLVGDWLLRVAFAMLKSRQLYKPALLKNQAA